MIRLPAFFFTVVVLTSCLECFGEEGPYARQNRVDYIAKTMGILDRVDLQTLENAYRYIGVVDRNSCQSSLSNLRLECMLNYANENCRSLRGKQARESCKYYSDLIITNKLGEKIFISKSERYGIAKNSISGNVQDAVNARLQQKHARIATLFALSANSDCDNNDAECMARGLDKFCLDYTNKKSLSWQYCVTAVVWFIGTAKTD